MTRKNATTLASEDNKRRAFMPIQMDLVDRLTRECDSLSSSRPVASPDKKTDNNKLAA